MKPLFSFRAFTSFAASLTAGAALSFGQGDDIGWVKDSIDGKNLHYETFLSETIGEDVSYLIYLPEAYTESDERRLPVMYWLHGLGGAQHGVPGFVRDIDEAISLNKMPPMIAVYVNGLRDSMYTDSKDGQFPVETVIIEDLIPHIDQNYRTIANRTGRLIEGFSMGGYGAARLGFKYPDLFGAVSILGGALHDETTLPVRRQAIFEKMYSNDLNYLQATTPQALLKENAPQLLSDSIIRIAVGDRDPVLEYNHTFHALLEAIEIPHEFKIIPDARHNPQELYKAMGDANIEFYSRVFYKE